MVRIIEDRPREHITRWDTEHTRERIFSYNFTIWMGVSAMIINENDTTGYFSPEEQAEYERILDNQYKDTGININELI